MADPFEAMALPATAIDPDPIFAYRLRERITLALARTKGDHVSQSTLEPAVAPGMTGATITPYVIVSGAEAAIEWYAEVFGARTVGDPIMMPNGSIGHAELDLAGARLMLSEGSAGAGVEPPDPSRGASVSLHLTLADVDGVFDRAVGAGAHPERPVADYPYGRMGVLRDPFGHRWMVMTEPAPRLRHGDVGYVSLSLPDVGQAAEFFSGVLGWRYEPAGRPEERQIEGTSLHHGLWETPDDHTLFCCYAVDSVADTIERVIGAGGTAEPAQRQPYGLISECTDDQGVRFAVFEPVGGAGTGSLPPEHGRAHGDVAYITMEVPDSRRTRDFYGSVLGWRFRPGRVEDGWVVEDVAPAVGVSGGHEAATTVPMYRVDDIVGAVASVRERGGHSTDPEVMPYGVTAECEDGQGTRFYLGQL